jgi:hypothetical protein
MKATTIKEAIQILAGTFNKDHIQTIMCKVDSVNLDDQTCDCTPIGGDNTTTIPSVALTTESNDGWLLVPSVGSTVQVTISIRNAFCFVSMFSNIDKAYLITENGIQLNDGSAGGLVKVAVLTQKVNALENMLNDLATKFNTHLHSGVTTGSGTSGPTTIPETTVIIPTQQSELENTKVTHG